MPDWKEILDTIQREGKDANPFDKIRRDCIQKLSEYTKRNVIIYYSGWLQKDAPRDISITDTDKNGFMTNIHGLDRSLGLDLILHTPGGDTAATESIVDYLRKMFNCDIRVFVPQLAMSAGTMIACACKEIWMGKQSSLGPIDPQILLPSVGKFVPAHGILNEVKTITEEIEKKEAKQFIWAQILSKYSPAFIGDCQNVVNWSREITSDWLKSCMFVGEDNAENLAKTIVNELCDHQETKTHSRHLSIDFCKRIGLKIKDLESDNKLQDLVLSVHHSCMATFYNTAAIKIIENQNNKSFIIAAMTN